MKTNSKGVAVSNRTKHPNISCSKKRDINTNKPQLLYKLLSLNTRGHHIINQTLHYSRGKSLKITIELHCLIPPNGSPLMILGWFDPSNGYPPWTPGITRRLPLLLSSAYPRAAAVTPMALPPRRLLPGSLLGYLRDIQAKGQVVINLFCILWMVSLCGIWNTFECWFTLKIDAIVECS